MRVTLPDHLSAALGRWHMQDDCKKLIMQLENYGQPVEVRRLTLGDILAPGFGAIHTVYRTADKDADKETS